MYVRAEHGEWAKITNWDFATHAPLMIHDPELTPPSRGMVTSDSYTEHVDLMPSLAQLALGMVVAPCGSASSSFATAECTEGVSLVPLMTAPTTQVKHGSFSQFPRPISGMRATAAWVRRTHKTQTQATHSQLVDNITVASRYSLLRFQARSFIHYRSRSARSTRQQQP